MNNDLISREALKEELSKECIHNCYYCRHIKWSKKMACSYCDVIDNAPPISKKELQKVFYETAEKPELKEVLAYECGKAAARPKGEWEEPFESNGKTYHKCNHCHISSELILFDNFCPHCGADMRKEGGK